MTRPTLTALILLAVLIVAYPTPREAQQPGVRPGNPAGSTGATAAEQDIAVVLRGTPATEMTVGVPFMPPAKSGESQWDATLSRTGPQPLGTPVARAQLSGRGTPAVAAHKAARTAHTPRKRLVASVRAATGPTRAGLASWMPEMYGRDYLALPDGAGLRVTICGAGGCWTAVSNDAGPDRAMQRIGRIADIAVGRWESICGVSRAMGLCNVSVTVIGRTK